MSNNITQDQLELCRLALVIARLQLKAMAVTAIALEKPTYGAGYDTLEREFEELSKQIFNGEIKGST